MDDTPCQVRPMTGKDVPAVRQIEGACYQFPWSEGVLYSCLLAGYHCRVLAENDHPVAHAIMSLAADEVHLMNLCVHPNWQGRGLGRRMLEHLLQVAHVKAARRMFLEVRPDNVQAQFLYFSAGFRRVGIRHDYYPTPDGREDALVLMREFTVCAHG